MHRWQSSGLLHDGCRASSAAGVRHPHGVGVRGHRRARGHPPGDCGGAGGGHHGRLVPRGHSRPQPRRDVRVMHGGCAAGGASLRGWHLPKGTAHWPKVLGGLQDGLGLVDMLARSPTSHSELLSSRYVCGIEVDGCISYTFFKSTILRQTRCTYCTLLYCRLRLVC